jgi:hypothetical protein
MSVLQGCGKKLQSGERTRQSARGTSVLANESAEDMEPIDQMDTEDVDNGHVEDAKRPPQCDDSRFLIGNEQVSM